MTSIRYARPLLWLIPFQAALALHVLSYISQPGKLESRALLLLAALTLAGALAVCGLALLLRSTLARFRRWRGALWIGLALAAFGLGIVARPEWLYAHLALNLALVGAALLRAIDPDGWTADMRIRRGAWIALGIGVMAVIGIRALGLSYAPDMQITDEPWHLGWVMGLLREGRFTDYLMYYGGHDVQRYYAPMALWLSAAGVGFWQARLYSFAFTLAVAAVGGLAAGRLYGRSAGWIAALLLFASANVLIGARIRHDAGLALAIALALWLYAIGIGRERRLWHLLAGLAVGLGWFAHYHAIIFGVGLLIGLYLPRWIARRTWRRALDGAAFGVGGLIGAAAVAWLQIAPHLAAGDSLARAGRGAGNLVGVLSASVAHLGSIAQHSQLELAIIVAAIGLALWRRGLTDLSLASALIVCHIGLGWAQRETWSHYPMPLTPLYMALVAGMIAPLDGRAVTRGALIVGALIALPMLGWTLQTPLTRAFERAPLHLPTPPAAQWVLDNIEPGAVIAGEHYYYFWLTDYRYVSPLTPNFMPDLEKTRLPSVQQVWDEIAPEIYIIDPNLSTCCVLQWMIDTDYFEARGYTIAARFDGQTHPITIYRKTS
jgi:4-amino-4-deoxy-L-arabinose transferase-like glycosyltransferase